MIHGAVEVIMVAPRCLDLPSGLIGGTVCTPENKIEGVNGDEETRRSQYVYHMQAMHDKIISRSSKLLSHESRMYITAIIIHPTTPVRAPRHGPCKSCSRSRDVGRCQGKNHDTAQRCRQ